MKKLFILLAVTAVFTSCQNIAEKYNLPANPGSGIIVEILDRSKTAESGYSDAVSYYNLTLSDPDWLDYLSPEVHFSFPGGDTEDITFGYSEASDGSIIIGGGYYSLSIPQGAYSFAVDTRTDNWWEEDTFTYNFDISISGSSNLSVREPYDYSAGSPYVCDTESSYTLAISDDEDTIYIQADDTTVASCDQVIIAAYTASSGSYRWGFGILISALETGKWTAIPVSKIETASGYSSPSADNFRSGTYYDIYVYTSTAQTESWGTLWRSETGTAATSGNEPAAADIIQLPSKRAFVSWTAEPTPLGEKFIKGELD